MPTSGLSDLIQQLVLPPDFVKTVDTVHRPLAMEIARRRASVDHSIVIGINGCQGSGKSTLAIFLQYILEQESGMRAEILSIDDLYYPKLRRRQLGESVHPLLRTRGVPGTHDIGLGADVIRQLCEASETSVTDIPRFDKATDDRVDRAHWDVVAGRPDIVILEGWCVCVPPQKEHELLEPLNSLEAVMDADGVWRHYVNTQISGPYAEFFQCVDCLIMLKAPSFEIVFDWRRQQEARLRESASQRAGCTGIMDDHELKKFIMHYERLTRHMLLSLPDRADILLELAADRSTARLVSRTKY